MEETQVSNSFCSKPCHKLPWRQGEGASTLAPCCREGKHRENRGDHLSSMYPDTFCTDRSPATKGAQAVGYIHSYGSGLGEKPLCHLFLVRSPCFFVTYIVKTRQPHLTTSTLVLLHKAFFVSGCLIKSGHPIKFEFQRTKG